MPFRPARRLDTIHGFGIDRVAAAAAGDPEVLRLENLDTDLAPPPGVIEATRAAVGQDDHNSYLPFTGRLELRQAVAEQVERRSGVRYDPEREVVITGGEGDNLLDVILALVDPGDEVLVTDPTYAGLINRVRLAGAIPRFVPYQLVDGQWRLDLPALEAAVSPRTRALALMSPSFPTGAVLDAAEWEAIGALLRRTGLPLIYWAIMEGLLFDGRPLLHPAALAGLRDQVITVGTVSIEYRMIGWRIGWVVAEARTLEAVARVHLYNAICPGGFGQAGSVVALRSPAADFAAVVTELERRRDTMMDQLAGLPAVRAAGGWSLLLDTVSMGMAAPEASERLLRHQVAATPMTEWGESVAPRHLRLVFSNEPVHRLQKLGERVRRALGG